MFAALPEQEVGYSPDDFGGTREWHEWHRKQDVSRPVGFCGFADVSRQRVGGAYAIYGPLGIAGCQEGKTMDCTNRILDKVAECSHVLPAPPSPTAANCKIKKSVKSERQGKWTNREVSDVGTVPVISRLI